MAAAIGLGLAYTAVMSTGDATIDAVERVHFVEYGLIAVLFYRVWRRAGDASTLVLPILCGFIVGTLDEWLQWFIPYRVGEMHDVLLNFTALVCGVLFGLALEPPPAFSWRPGPDGWSRIGVARRQPCWCSAPSSASCIWVTCCTSKASAHSRRAIRWSSSSFAARSRRAMAGGAAPQHSASVAGRSVSRRGVMARARTQPVDGTTEDITAAWHENLILERFFAPVLDRQTYVSVNGNRWPPSTGPTRKSRAIPDPAFVSQAESYPILAWSKNAVLVDASWWSRCCAWDCRC